MTRTEKNALRQLRSTRQLMDIRQLTDSGLQTGHGELAFFMLRPFNLSVLSEEDIRGHIEELATLFRSVESVELLALDSRESFQHNKNWYQKRLEEETVPAVRKLLRQDMEHLDTIRLSTVLSREFALVFRFKSGAEPGGALQISQLEKAIQDRGFHVRKAERQDMMRLLAVYYEHNVTTEHFDEVDGEQWVMA